MIQRLKTNKREILPIAAIAITKNSLNCVINSQINPEK